MNKIIQLSLALLFTLNLFACAGSVSKNKNQDQSTLDKG